MENRGSRRRYRAATVRERYGGSHGKKTAPSSATGGRLWFQMAGSSVECRSSRPDCLPGKSDVLVRLSLNVR